MTTVKSRKAAADWFVANHSGAVIVEGQDGARMKVGSYPEAICFFDGERDTAKVRAAGN